MNNIQLHVFQRLTISGTRKKATIKAYVPFKVKKVKFNFAYTIVNSSLPNIIITSPLVSNDIVGNINSSQFESKLSAQITQAQFDSAVIPNYKLIELPGRLYLSLENPTFGYTSTDSIYITPEQWAAARITYNNDPLITVNDIECTIDENFGLINLGNTCIIRKAIFDAAAIANTNNPLTLLLDFQCELGEGTGPPIVDDTAVYMTPALFNALAIPNVPQITTLNSIPIEITDNTVLNNQITDLTAYVSTTQFNTSVINASNNPLTLGAAMNATCSDSALTLTISPAAFLTGNIANTNNPLTAAANIPVLVNGAASIDTVWSVGGLASSDAVEYIFKDPITVNGDVVFDFIDLNSTTNDIIFGNIIAHMEFLA